MAVSADAYLLTIYKTWYTDEKFEALLWRNSPLMKVIQKKIIGGKNYNFANMWGRGGAVSGDLTVAASIAASSGSKNAEFSVPPGKIFSVFNVTTQEMMASRGKRAAYISAVTDRMFASTDAFRKALAASLYGAGYGEIGVVGAVVALGATTMTLSSDAIIKMDVDTQFQITAGTTGLPNEAFLTGGPYTVTAIQGNQITFTPALGAATTALSILELSGGRDGSANPNMPVGLKGWLPNYFHRGAAGGSDLTNWTSYIGNTFFGVTRSIAQDRLAGQYYKLGTFKAGEKYIDAVTSGVRLVRRAGGVPKALVVNDNDYQQLLVDANAQVTYFQSINTTDKKAKPEVVKGISDLRYAFSSTWVENVYDDPFCPTGTAYILDTDVIEFVGLTNSEKPLDDNVPGNDPGHQDADAIGDLDLQYKFVIDDFITINPGTNTANGPAAQVILQLYGSYVVRAPFYCCVVDFV
jgi:hypothetical protein